MFKYLPHTYTLIKAVIGELNQSNEAQKNKKSLPAKHILKHDRAIRLKADIHDRHNI